MMFFHVVFKCLRYAAIFSEHCPQYDRAFHLELIRIGAFYGDLVTELHILSPYRAMFEPYCHTVVAVYLS